MVGFNGLVHGYFKGKRGLRQGDPLSPYLFVIVMNCLSVMLNNAAYSGALKFHPKCEKSGLTHLSFADDLLIFADGSVESVQCVLQVLHQFQQLSGLAISRTKTSFFTSAVSQEVIDAIAVSTGLSQGSLPIRYLGVPLCTKKLTIANCEPLLQQIKGKITSWSARSLSYAGRLLLLTTVVAEINNFWCSTFTLPKSCIAKINSMCSSFLWKGSVEGRHSAKVAWEAITKPKSEGGLGIKNLFIWNKACMLRLVWMLFTQAGSIWAAWYREEILGGSLCNFWRIKKKNNYSWMANKILKAKDCVYSWIKMRVGNDSSCRFWWDNWSPFGKLLDFLNEGNKTRLGIPLASRLEDLCIDGAWSLPPARTENQVLLHAYLTTLFLNNEEDTYEWEINGNVITKFSTGFFYDCLREVTASLPWVKSVWIKGGIPRHSFLCWLFCLNRCPTKNRLIQWGINTDPTCLLCQTAPESRDHLYYQCSFSWDLWQCVAQRCQFTAAQQWTQTVTDLQSLPAAGSYTQLVLLAWQSTMYYLWAERNNRLHNSSFRSGDSIFLQIDSSIRNRISSRRDQNPGNSSRMLQMLFSTDH